MNEQLVEKANKRIVNNQMVGQGVELFSVAILTYGAGDIITTYAGIKSGIAREANPFAAHMLNLGGFTSLVMLKAILFMVFISLWYVTDSRYSYVVPLIVLVMGVIITVFNSITILMGL